MKSTAVLRRLRTLGHENVKRSMERFGIDSTKALGISIPVLRSLAKEIGVDHDLASVLWKSGIHEARILASLIGDPAKVTEEQMDEWVSEFDSWDVCDGCCGNLFDRTKFARTKAFEYSKREREFEKRAGFSLMAYLAVHDKNAPDKEFLDFLPVIKREAIDERNFVRKSVNWALRQIGKRNLKLNRAAIKTAKEISEMKDSKSARWVAYDALRELQSMQVTVRLKKIAR